MDAVVTVQDLHKSYHAKPAVDGISFTVAAGETFGLVGPNGAGKTTTIEIIEGLRTADTGTVSVLGLDPVRRRRALYRQAGTQLQEGSLPKRIKVGEALDLFASFYDNPAPAAELIASCGLESIRRSYYGNLSGGEKKRVLLALALVGRPRVLILDEPTSGMDPQARYNVWELLRDLREGGLTVLLTTHYLDEAERECDTICLIDHGKVVLSGAPAALLREEGMAYAVRLPVASGADPDKLTAAVRAVDAVRQADPLPDGILAYGDAPDLTERLRTAVPDALVDWPRLESRPARLEDLYLHLTGRTYRKG